MTAGNLSDDPQVEPLIRIFELYLLQDAALDDMREPTAVATRAMLNSGMSPEIVLSMLEAAVQVAAGEVLAPEAEEKARVLADQIGPWLLGECFDSSTGSSAPELRD